MRLLPAITQGRSSCSGKYCWPPPRSPDCSRRSGSTWPQQAMSTKSCTSTAESQRRSFCCLSTCPSETSTSCIRRLRSTASSSSEMPSWRRRTRRFRPASFQFRSALCRLSSSTRSLADVQRIYLQSVRDGADYNLASIPSAFSHSHPQPFDKSYMAALFELGFTQAEHGSPWMKTPPGLPSGSGIWARSALR